MVKSSLNMETELHNLSTEHPDQIAYWRARLITELEGREEGFVHNGELVVVANNQQP